ncbi:hypothetical protein BH10BAC1_BH10BAC1_08530 [soil metagenome]
MYLSNTKRLLLPFLFLFCFYFQGTTSYCANDSLKSIPALVNDSSKVEVRQLNAEEQQKLLDNTDYKYDRIGPAPKSMWDRFKEWFWRMIDELFDSKGGKVGLSIFQYILIAAVIIIIVLLVLKNDIRAVFFGKSASVAIDFKEFDEDIHKINFDELIATAISKGDYRKAVRLHFLKLLKELTDNNLITWQIDKTNNDYSMELSSSKYNSKFRELALMYEYIWYGDFQLDESNFKSTILKFKEFKVTA